MQNFSTFPWQGHDLIAFIATSRGTTLESRQRHMWLPWLWPLEGPCLRPRPGEDVAIETRGRPCHWKKLCLSVFHLLFIITGSSSGFRLALKLLATTGRKTWSWCLVSAPICVFLGQYQYSWLSVPLISGISDKITDLCSSGSVLPLAEPSCEPQNLDQNYRISRESKR